MKLLNGKEESICTKSGTDREDTEPRHAKPDTVTEELSYARLCSSGVKSEYKKSSVAVMKPE